MDDVAVCPLSRRRAAGRSPSDEASRPRRATVGVKRDAYCRRSEAGAASAIRNSLVKRPSESRVPLRPQRRPANAPRGFRGRAVLKMTTDVEPGAGTGLYAVPRCVICRPVDRTRSANVAGMADHPVPVMPVSHHVAMRMIGDRDHVTVEFRHDLAGFDRRRAGLIDLKPDSLRPRAEV